MKHAIAFTSLLMVVSCATHYKTKTVFNLDQAKIINEEGKNVISGSALIRQINGGVVTCAGNQVELIPVTEYAAERFTLIYGNVNGGVVSPNKKFEFDNKYPEYFNYRKVSQCDAMGFFKFDNLADGDYYVLTHVVWQTNPYFFEGGVMARRVTAKDGKEIKVTLAP